MATTSNGVQTITRAAELLNLIAADGGSASVSALSATSGLPIPTVHRLLRALVEIGFVRQAPSRKYALGPRLISLGQSAGHALGAAADPFLARLVETTGETANLAVLDGDMIVYVAQVPSRHSMRMFTEIGRRVLPHCTGVGKALLAQLSNDAVADLVRRTGMPALTGRTVTTLEALVTDLDLIRARGWAEDDGEQEVGVHCLAVALPGIRIAVALSISGPEGRITTESGATLGPVLMEVAADFGAAISEQH